MTTVAIVISVYLIAGLILTRTVLSMPSRRPSFWDMVVGAFTMPVLFIALLACIAFENLWKRLLIALDYNPPEEMRAGPETPGERDSGKNH